MKQLTILLIIILGVFAQEEKHIEKIKNNIARADRPLCEYHTYEWFVSQTLTAPSKFYSIPNLKDRLYGTSPIRNVITYLPQPNNLEKQIEVLCDGIQPTLYEPNKPNLFLTCFSHDNSIEFPYQICSDLLMKIYDDQVIDNLISEMNANSLPPLFLKKIEDVKTKNIPRFLTTLNKNKLWIIERGLKVIDGIVFCSEKISNGKNLRTLALYQMTSQSTSSCQVDFIVDKEGNLIIIPFSYSHYNVLYSASLLVADALEEEVFYVSGETKNE